MPAYRHLQRSVLIFAALAAGTAMAAAQEPSVQKLLERGALSEAVERANEDGGNPESTFLAAQALIKMEHGGEAAGRFEQLRDADDDAWKAIGESGAELLAGNTAAAMDAANRAVEAQSENPYAHYQLGLVAAKENNFQRAQQAFVRSVELKPDFAYGHYYAGLASQRLRQTAKMTEHLNIFLRLAPDAPERQAVAAMLRGLR